MLTGTLLLGGKHDEPGPVQPLASEGFPQVFVDNRTTFYSRVGDWFAIGMSLLTVGMTAWMLCTRMLQKRRAKAGRAQG